MPNKETIHLKDAIAIGIGGMFGGGIFAVLGLTISMAKGGIPLAFLFADVNLQNISTVGSSDFYGFLQL